MTLDSDELLRMERMYATESTVQACARVLQASVLGGGLRLLRDGANVDLKPAFTDHLNTHWLAFARSAVDSVLAHGFVAVTLCAAPPPPFGAKPKPNEDRNVIPCVADYSTCRVEMRRKGPLVREYVLVLMDGTVVDKSMIFVKTPPNHEGQSTSPLQSIKAPLVFMQRLIEYAMQAEAVATRQQIVTQPVPRLGKQNPNLETESMFFDSGVARARLPPFPPHFTHPPLTPPTSRFDRDRVQGAPQGRRVRKGCRAPALAHACRRARAPVTLVAAYRLA